MNLTIARSFFRSGILLCLLLAAYVDGHLRKRFFGLRPGHAGAIWVHGWCRRIVYALRIPCTIDGPIPCAGEQRVAVTSNHLSYLDILVYSAVRPFVMVAKSEVRSWPLIGWITAQAGTVYVQRADVKGGRTQSHDQVNAAMAAAFQSGLPVLFFPEGTTSDGAGVLAFRRGLFHSVIEGKVLLKTAAVAYSLDRPDGRTSIAEHVCYWGEMEFGPHLFRCLGVEGLQAHVRFGEKDVTPGDRFTLAQGARDQVAGIYAELTREAVRASVGKGHASPEKGRASGRPLLYPPSRKNEKRYS